MSSLIFLSPTPSRHNRPACPRPCRKTPHDSTVPHGIRLRGGVAVSTDTRSSIEELDGSKPQERALKNVAWGILNGWIGATGLAIFPLLITFLTDGDLSAFADLGGVGPYLLWCFTAGTVGGAIVGAGRRYLEAPLGRGVVTGLVTASGFGTQIVMLWGSEVPADVLTFLLPVTFIAGFIMSPLVARGFSHWPSLDGVFDGLVLSQGPGTESDDEDREAGSTQ